MGPVICSETLVTNYQSEPRDVPDRNSQVTAPSVDLSSYYFTSFYCQQLTVQSVIASYICLSCYGVETNRFVSNLLLADDNITE